MEVINCEVSNVSSENEDALLGSNLTTSEKCLLTKETVRCTNSNVARVAQGMRMDLIWGQCEDLEFNLPKESLGLQRIPVSGRYTSLPGGGS